MTILHPIDDFGDPLGEQLIFYGNPGEGKTRLAFTIAKWHQDLGSDAVFYVINTDRSWKVLRTDPEFSVLKNVRIREVFSLQDMYDTVREFGALLRDQDWLIIDLYSAAWSGAQDEYAQLKVAEGGVQFEDLGDLLHSGTDPDEYPITGWEWGYSNGRMNRFAEKNVVKGKGHRILVCGQAPLPKPTPKMEEKEDRFTKQTREMFSHVRGPGGVVIKPDWQKRDPFRWHSIFHVEAIWEGEDIAAQKILTAKERWPNRKRLGRDVGMGHWTGARVDDFYIDYLVTIAGWKM